MEEERSYFDLDEDKVNHDCGWYKPGEPVIKKPLKGVSLLAFLIMVLITFLSSPTYIIAFLTLLPNGDGSSPMSIVSSLMFMVVLVLPNYFIHTTTRKFFIAHGLKRGSVGRIINRIWQLWTLIVVVVMTITLFSWLFNWFAMR